MSSTQPVNRPDVVCFGMITLARVLVVDKMPDWNTGAVSAASSEFVSDDAAIVAGLLTSWNVSTELVGTALGDDEAGKWTVRRLKEMGVGGSFELREGMDTPFEVNISDSLGGRTYFWDRRPQVLATLDDADLSSVDGAKLLYVDWYDAPHIVRAMKAAKSAGVPVMLNLEHGHTNSDSLATLVPYASVCQAVTDAAQIDTDAESVARFLIEQGIETALVTMASGGVVGIRGDDALHVSAPELQAVDTCGAGATFSAAYIASVVSGTEFEQSLRFAVAAASLKCTAVGLKAFPKDEIRELAASLKSRRLG